MTAGTASTATTQSFTVGPDLDSSGGFTGTWTSGSSFTVASLTTADSPDVIIVWVVTNLASSSITVSSISDSASAITWQNSARQSLVSCTGTQETTETEWWGVAQSPISTADTITANLSGTPTAASGEAFGVDGANTTSPFDPNAAVPATAVSACTATKVAPTATLSATTNANDLVIASFSAYTSVTEAAPAGFTLVKHVAATGGSESVVYEQVAATQSGLNCPGFATTTTYWRVVCDAIVGVQKDYEIEPQKGAATLVGTPSTLTPMGYGWETAKTLGGATIDSGAWTFTLTAAASSITGSPVGYIWTTVWSCATISLGTCTFLLKNYDNSTNVLSTTTATANVYTTGTLGPFTNVDFLVVQSWLVVLSSSSSAVAATAAETTVSSASSVATPTLEYDVSPSLSLSPTLSHVALTSLQSSSLALSPSLAIVRGFAKSVSLSLALSPSLNQALSGITSNANTTLTPTLGGILGFVDSLSASIGLAPSVDQDLAGISGAVSISLSAAMNQGLAGLTESVTTALTPMLTSMIAFIETLSASMSLAPSIGEDLAGVTQSASLALSPALAATLAFFATLSASLSLAPSIGQAIDGVTSAISMSLSSSLGIGLAGIIQSVSTAISPSLGGVAAFLATLSASISLTPALNQGIDGVTSALAISLTPVLTAAVAFFSTLSASISLAPSVGQDLAGVANSLSLSLSQSMGQDVAGVTNSVSTTLTPALDGVAAFLATVSASLSLTPGVDQDISGLTQSVSIALSPGLSSLAAFAQMLSASVSIGPSLNQDLAGLTTAVSVSLTSSLSEDLAGITASVTTTLTPSLSSVAAFLATLSQSISLAPSVNQDIAGVTSSLSVALSPSLSAFAAFMETLSASVSLAPAIDQSIAGISNAVSLSLSSSIDQGIAGITSSVSTALTPTLAGAAEFLEALSASLSLSPSLNQGLAGVTNSFSIALSPLLTGGASFLATISAALSLAPSIGQGLSGITQSLSSSLTASVDQGLSGVTQAVTITISPLLQGMIAFFEAVFGVTSLAPSLNVANGLVDYASVALAPSLMVNLPTLPASVTSLACSPGVVARGISATCTATVTGASPTGTISFSSASGTFTPSSTCTLVGGSCEVEFVAPPSPGSSAITASYSGDGNNAGSSQAFAVTVPVFNLSLASGATGTSTDLSGSGFVPSGLYDYCFESSVGSVSSAVACSQTHQFVASASGAIPALTGLVPSGQAGLVVVSDSEGGLAAFQSFSVTQGTTQASITLTPDTGSTGTPVTVTGSGFTPGATITLAYTNGTLLTDPPTITASSGGTFSATIIVPSSIQGASGNLVTAIGSDPSDSTYASFTATNVASYQTASVTISAGGKVEVNQSGTTGVTLSISSPSSASGTVVISGLNHPSFGVSSASFKTVSYYDVYVSSSIPGSATALICFTEPSVTGSSVMQYWNGGSWVTSDSVVTGTTICNSGSGAGVIDVSTLSGTNFAIGSSPTGGGGGGARYISQSIKLTPATDGGSVGFSLSGCGVIPSVIQGDGVAHHIAAYPDCTVSVTAAAPKSDTTRWVFAGGNQTLQVASCGGLNCSSSVNATYYEQVLQNLSYAVVGSAEGYSAPTVTGFQFGSAYPLTLTTSQAGYWLDASGTIASPTLLPGSGALQRWSLVPSSMGILSAEAPNSAVLVYALQYSVSLAVSPQGAGTTSPSGQNWLNASSTITIAATTHAGFRFSGWVSSTGSTALGSAASATTSATVSGADTLTATFAPAGTTGSSSTSASSTSSSSTSSASSSSATSTSSTASGSSSSASSSGTATSTNSSSSSTSTTTGGAPAFSMPLLIIAAIAAAIAVAGALAVRKTRKTGKSAEA